MASLATKAFAALTAGAAALMPVPGVAQDAPANQNATPIAATQSIQYVGAENETLSDARLLAASASRDKIAIVVWGGTRQFQQEAYNAALDLNDMGIRVAFVRAPDYDGSDGGSVFQIYGLAVPRVDGAVGFDNVDQLRVGIRQAALEVHQELFPQRVAALQPTAGR